MPIYEYKCDNCEKVFEVRQKFSDPLVTTHEECGGPVHRLLSAPAFQFKGSGWYITDYARAGSSSKEPAKGEAKSESKSESKSGSDGGKSSAPASTSESKPSSSESSSKSETKSDTSKK